MRRTFPILFFILALLCSCEDIGDDYRYPSVITDYVSLSTDDDGEPLSLHLDNGSTYPIIFTEEYNEAHSTLPTYKADTLYRVISIYELGDDSVAYIYSMTQTISIIPTPLRDGEILCQSPVYLQSQWLSGGYLNMVIEIKGLNGREHRIGFVDTTPQYMQGKEITFYHDAGNDIESYRQKLHVSIPIDLQQGDTLRFVVNLYEKGVTTLEYAL